MKLIIIGSVSYVVAALVILSILSFMTGRDVCHDAGYRGVIKSVVGGLVMVWMVLGLHYAGTLL
ncbi:hypothetical protein VH79_25765 [Salmonella enterica]|uniref:Uncharacterized protein n=1 Tax=Salmonella enterica TaxID=28901 RepID=A0A5U3IT81_SALER|nr:hypothetical protein [Salmonella enterica]